jgi:hypothetical protein
MHVPRRRVGEPRRIATRWRTAGPFAPRARGAHGAAQLHGEA